MKWFGSEWGAAVCDPENWVKTPIGVSCKGCGYMVKMDHRGILVPVSGPASDAEVNLFGVPHWAYHLGCLLDVVLGPRLSRRGALRDDVDPDKDSPSAR